MKFPFDLSITLVFRLLLPGAVLAVALTPLMDGWARAFGRELALEAALPIAAIIFGWIVVLLDQPIYMAFEGRRYWPSQIRKLGLWLEKRRLKHIKAEEAKNLPDSVEWSLRTLDFPLSHSGDREAIYPTRLGNLLAAVERYPTQMYGIDGVFYWYRIWPQLDKDLRGEIDQSQAVADSGLYVSACLAFSALLGFGYLLMGLPRFADYPAVDMPLLPAPGVLFGGSLAALLAAYVLYRISLSSQRVCGEMFRALFDVYRDKLSFIDGVVSIATAKGAGDPGTDQRQKYMTAWRFLRWYRVRAAGATANHKPT
ncbi:MAG: hypothetical protein NW206_17755 [Hyphomonadaceae bacterium]|nr:hypothetical protein [Hyphomonadaceae bacterium]